MNWESIKTFFAELSLRRILPAVLILVVGFLLVKLMLKLFDRALSRSRLDKTMFTFLKTIMRVLLYAILLLVAAGSLGIDVTSLVAILSVVSLAVSLAVQNTLANVVGSMTLLGTHPFKVGDYVELGSDAGTVEEITLNYTKLLTADGRRIYIPNNDAAASRICNYSVEGRRRLDLTFTASYGDPVEKVKAVLLEATEGERLLPETSPTILVNGYKDSAVEYMVQLWTTPEDFFDVKFSVIEKVKGLFDREGITIPFPQVEVRTK